jgi:hypothetical protein
MAVSIIRDARSGISFSSLGGKRAYLYTERGTQTFYFRFAPRDIEYGGMSSEWVETERSGNTPLLLRKGDHLATVKFSFTLVYVNGANIPVTEAIGAFRAVAKSQERVLFMYSELEAGMWRVTDASFSTDQRSPETNEPTRAVGSVTLTRASDPAVATGPISGGAGAGTAAPKPAPPRTYRVVKGDCLWNISLKFYGKGTLWPKIYDANRNLIKDPHWIYVNQVFVIP